MTGPAYRLLLAGISLAFAGCGKPEPPPRAAVSGLVTIGGRPVPSALVTF